MRKRNQQIIKELNGEHRIPRWIYVFITGSILMALPTILLNKKILGHIQQADQLIIIFVILTISGFLYLRWRIKP